MIKLSDFFLISNLLCIIRILIAPVIILFLISGTDKDTIIALILITIASITDGLDGYLARKLDQVSHLGIALDPIADKIFAAILVVGLIFYREFPIWLALIIIGRDILILIAGLILIRGRDINLPSNLTGKYAFTALAVLLVSYVINFEFGITTCTILTILFVVLSLIGYGRVFLVIRKSQDIPVFIDRTIFKVFRYGGILIYSMLFFYNLYIEKIQ